MVEGNPEYWSATARSVIRCVLDCVCVCAVALLVATSSVRAQSANDGFNVTVDNSVVASAVQADGKILIGGYFGTVNGQTRTHLARLFVDGALDPGFADLDNDVGITSLTVLDDGSIIVGGEFTHFGTCQCAHLVRLFTDGSVDPAFHPNPDGAISAIARQRDGRLLIAGSFTHLGANTHHYIARINKDGSVDDNYPPPDKDPDQPVSAIAVLPDGKAIIGGAFTMIGAQSVSRIVRLRIDGSVDNTFTPAKPIDGPINALVVRLDGKIVIGGVFVTINGSNRKYLARLNEDGTLDSGYPDLDDFVYALALQPDGKMLVGGNFFLVGAAEANKIARFKVDNTFDTGFRPRYVSTAYITASVRTFAVQADGRVVAGGTYTPFDGHFQAVGRLNFDGSFDTDYPSTAAPGYVYALGPQTDQKVLVGMAFSAVAGNKFLRRVKPDGSDDPFAGFTVNGDVVSIALQPDRKFLVSGNFDIAGNVYPRHAPARFGSDGVLDAGFIDPLVMPSAPYGVALNANDDITIFGRFSSVLGFTRDSIAVLNDDGGVDGNFTGPQFGDEFTNLYAVSARADGNLLVAGTFKVGTNARRVAVLNTNGAFDATFDKAAPNNTVTSLIRQPDGKTLIGGFFSSVADGGVGYPRHGVARLNEDGSLDPDFFDTEAEPDSYVSGMALQADGKVVIVGQFGSINSQLRNRIARLNTDGTLDEDFSDAGGADAVPSVVAVQQDGRPIVGGNFLHLGATARSYLARLSLRDAALQSLRVDAANTVVTWLRGGASPELSLPARLQLSYDGVNFATLGTMQRISGGWRFVMPAQAFGTVYYLRALGPVSDGINTGWVESVIQARANEYIFASGFE
jgi:uncharacterized delta-60 repeat protein